MSEEFALDKRASAETMAKAAHAVIDVLIEHGVTHPADATEIARRLALSFERAYAKTRVQHGEVTLEFDCLDCGVHVYAFGLPHDDRYKVRCARCIWIRETTEDDADARTAMRVRMYDEDELKHWQSVGCYVDETFSERACDRCGKAYRGPAVYCCLTCTEADV